MEELGADGIDFVGLFFDSPFANDHTIYQSYTREEFMETRCYPKTNYKFWKIVDGKKEYIASCLSGKIFIHDKNNDS